MKRKRPYVLFPKSVTDPVVKMLEEKPSEGTHGAFYRYAIGPFKTKIDAVVYASEGYYRAPIPVWSTSFKATEEQRDRYADYA